jgi:hypothetical protein
VLVEYVAICKNIYCFYNENIVMLTELLFDKLSYKIAHGCSQLKLS